MDRRCRGSRATEAKFFRCTASREERHSSPRCETQAVHADHAATDFGVGSPAFAADAIALSPWNIAQPGSAPGPAGSGCPDKNPEWAFPAAIPIFCEG